MRQRLADWLREQRIKRLADCPGRGDGSEPKSLWNRLRDECNARSPEQVERMERRRGLR